MTLSLPQLDAQTDLHTGDLTAKCKMSVALRRLGKFDPVVPTAMLRGNVFGRAVELVLVDGVDHATAPQDALVDVRLQCRREGREFTQGAEKALPSILEDVSRSLVALPEAMDYLGGGEPPIVVGCELPMRGEMIIDGVAQPMATHLDILLQQRKTGRHVVVDCKWRDEAPTQAYLARNLQFALMWWLMRNGRVQFPSGKFFTMESECLLAWLHAPYLLPAGRVTHLTDAQTGEPFTLKKGERRPIDKAVRWVGLRPEHEASVVDEIGQHVRAMRLGIWPTNADPISCHLCESERWCPRYDTALTAC